MERAELGVDGNAGFALLGEDLQSGEAEFVEFDNDLQGPERARAGRIAATKAYRLLKARLPDRTFSYWIGPSHPDHV